MTFARVRQVIADLCDELVAAAGAVGDAVGMW